MTIMLDAGQLDGDDGRHHPDRGGSDRRVGYGRDLDYRLTGSGHALLDDLGVTLAPSGPPCATAWTGASSATTSPAPSAATCSPGSSSSTGCTGHPSTAPYRSPTADTTDSTTRWASILGESEATAGGVMRR